MRARVSILAWAKAALFGAAVAGVVALVAVAPWNVIGREQRCAPLHDQIARVEKDGQVRVSDAVMVTQGSIRARSGLIDMSVEEGDFDLAWTLDQVRDCLGPEWSETAAHEESEVHGEAWVFVRAGGPMLSFIRSRTDSYGRFSDEIVIEPMSGT